MLVAYSCAETNKNEYEIRVNSPKLYDGVRSYIKGLDERGKEIILDSAIASKQNLQFNGTVDIPEIGFLSINGLQGQLMMFLENESITIELDTMNIAMSKIKGSELNNELQAFNKSFMEVRMSLQPHVIAYREAQRQKDIKASDSIKAIMTDIGAKSLRFPLEYVKSHPDSFLSLYIIESQIGSSSQLNYEDYKEAFEAIDTSLQNSPVGIKAQQKLEQERLKFEKDKVTSVGNKVPDFKAPTPSGESLALSEVYSKGKYTIIDFWAAWCGPCRRENPNVVRIYNKYHDKGLEIIGVSLDGNRNQKNPKDAWIKAIETDKLTWNHVSNLQYFGPIARQYNVNAIPAMFIVDQQGTIVAKNLRGQALENKIAELLGS